MSNGDGASLLFRFAESVVNIAHVPKECLYYPRKQTSVSYAADCDVERTSLTSTLPPRCIALTTRLSDG